jgi:hypothetical protein
MSGVYPMVTANQYQRDRARSSLDRVQGEAPATEAQIRAMAAKAFGQGVIMFLRADLQRLPDWSRAVIEGEAKRLYGSGK